MVQWPPPSVDSSNGTGIAAIVCEPEPNKINYLEAFMS